MIKDAEEKGLIFFKKVCFIVYFMSVIIFDKNKCVIGILYIFFINWEMNILLI